LIQDYHENIRNRIFISKIRIVSVDVLATAKEQSSALPLMEDDSLVIRCDVTVLNVEK
jgi:hypothetical protein